MIHYNILFVYLGKIGVYNLLLVCGDHLFDKNLDYSNNMIYYKMEQKYNKLKKMDDVPLIFYKMYII
jgi:hypothetical protein